MNSIEEEMIIAKKILHMSQQRDTCVIYVAR